MVKKNIIKIAGLLDEDFFLYAEEVNGAGRGLKNKESFFGNLWR